MHSVALPLVRCLLSVVVVLMFMTLSAVALQPGEFDVTPASTYSDTVAFTHITGNLTCTVTNTGDVIAFNLETLWRQVIYQSASDTANKDHTLYHIKTMALDSIGSRNLYLPVLWRSSKVLSLLRIDDTAIITNPSPTPMYELLSDMVKVTSDRVVAAFNAHNASVVSAVLNRPTGIMLYFAVSDTPCLQRMGLLDIGHQTFGNCLTKPSTSPTPASALLDGDRSTQTYGNILSLDSRIVKATKQNDIFIVDDNGHALRVFSPATMLLKTIYSSASAPLIDVSTFMFCAAITTADEALHIAVFNKSFTIVRTYSYPQRAAKRVKARPASKSLYYISDNVLGGVLLPDVCTNVALAFSQEEAPSLPGLWTPPPPLSKPPNATDDGSVVGSSQPHDTQPPNEDRNEGAADEKQDRTPIWAGVSAGVSGILVIGLLVYGIIACRKKNGDQEDQHPRDSPRREPHTEEEATVPVAAGTVGSEDRGHNTVEFSTVGSNPDASIHEVPITESPNSSNNTNSAASTTTTTAVDSSTSNEKKPIVFKKGRMIGSGGFGRVYLGLDENSGMLMAGKEIAMGPSASQDMEKTIVALQKELNIMKMLKHKHVVRYVGADRRGTDFYILMEYVPGGTLRRMIDEFGAMKYSLAAEYTRQMLLGLEYIHSNGIVHRDIKAANILIDVEGIVKIGDFGASRNFETISGMSGTPNWMAPEAVRGNASVSWPSDIWSLGCTVIEMLTGRIPLADVEGGAFKVMYFLGSSEDPMPIPEGIDGSARDFLETCLQRDDTKRPTASEMLLHPFVREAHGNARMSVSATPSPSDNSESNPSCRSLSHQQAHLMHAENISASMAKELMSQTLSVLESNNTDCNAMSPRAPHNSVDSTSNSDVGELLMRARRLAA